MHPQYSTMLTGAVLGENIGGEGAMQKVDDFFSLSFQDTGQNN